MIPINAYEKINQNLLDFPIFRFGTVPDGSCFFHSLSLCLSPEYVNLNIPDKIQFVQTLRNKIADEIDINTFKIIGHGEFCVESMSVYIRKYIHKLYDKDSKFTKKCIENCIPISFIELYTDLIDYNTQISLFESCFKGTNMNLTNLKNSFYKELYKYFFDQLVKTNSEMSDIKKIMNAFTKFYEYFYDYIIQKSYNHFIKEIRNVGTWFNMKMLEIVMHLFRCNIYIFNLEPQNISLYQIDDKSIYKYDNNILMLNIHNAHFEALGVQNDNQIIVSFSNDSQVIKDIRSLFVSNQ